MVKERLGPSNGIAYLLSSATGGEPKCWAEGAATFNAEIPVKNKHYESSHLYRVRHSLAHVLANAAVEIWPQTRYAVGPPTEHGFYYDLEVRDQEGNDARLSDQDLKKLQKRMRRIVQRGQTFDCESYPREEAIRFWRSRDQIYKVDMLDRIADDTVTYYRNGDFVDLCRGPHVGNTNELRYFELTTVSGAYWRGDSSGPQLQRVHGIAFETKEDLEAHKKWLIEVERRDHRRLGQSLDLFHFEDGAGRGLPLYHPNAGLMRSILARYLEDEHLRRGYQIVSTPYIMRAELWKQTGHYDHYREMMYLLEKDEDDYAIKPMNCPGHALIFRHRPRSYRELPIRYYEFGRVLRAEYSGTVHGLMRARLFTQDDAHIFCTIDQLEDEVAQVLDFATEMMRLFNFGYDVYLATRPEDGSVGDDESWEQATRALASALEKRNIPFDYLRGEGAFYGPKIEFSQLDAMGRRWTGPTIQVDFNLAPSLGATYVDRDNQEKHPVVVHRVVIGSWERFFGVAIEHFAGAFPVWLSATQVNITPVSERFLEYGLEVRDRLRRDGIRAECDTSDEKLGRKIRNSEAQRWPYTIVVGEKEKDGGTVSVRARGRKDLGVFTYEDFVSMVREKIETKALDV